MSLQRTARYYSLLYFCQINLEDAACGKLRFWDDLMAANTIRERYANKSWPERKSDPHRDTLCSYFRDHFLNMDEAGLLIRKLRAKGNGYMHKFLPEAFIKYTPELIAAQYSRDQVIVRELRQRERRGIFPA